MTAGELIAAGVAFRRNDRAQLRPFVDEGRDDLAAVVRTEVRRRVEPLREMPPARRYGECDGCGDVTPHKGGFCELCSVARSVALGL